MTTQSLILGLAQIEGYTVLGHGPWTKRALELCELGRVKVNDEIECVQGRFRVQGPPCPRPVSKDGVPQIESRKFVAYIYLHQYYFIFASVVIAKVEIIKTTRGRLMTKVIFSTFNV